MFIPLTLRNNRMYNMSCFNKDVGAYGFKYTFE